MDKIEMPWILMFYSMPSKPERNRLRIYRKLQKEGTLTLKDGVHLLPFSEDRFELFMWLRQEIKTLGGEMHFSIVEKFETLSNEEVIALFQSQIQPLYDAIEQKIKILNSEVSDEITQEQEQALKKIMRDFEAIYAVDFFESSKGKIVKENIEALQIKLDTLFISKPLVELCDIKNYQYKKWQTRKKPFVDRMASAWLIAKYIDHNAEFVFCDSIDVLQEDTITYDMDDAIFTHIGDLCTFEVLLHSFSLNNDIALNAISKIIHNLDLNDDKYIAPEADGIRLILSAIREGESDDIAIIEKSNTIFDYLYATMKK